MFQVYIFNRCMNVCLCIGVCLQKVISEITLKQWFGISACRTTIEVNIFRPLLFFFFVSFNLLISDISRQLFEIPSIWVKAFTSNRQNIKTNCTQAHIRAITRVVVWITSRLPAARRTLTRFHVRHSRTFVPARHFPEGVFLISDTSGPCWRSRLMRCRWEDRVEETRVAVVLLYYDKDSVVRLPVAYRVTPENWRPGRGAVLGINELKNWSLVNFNFKTWLKQLNN